MKNLLFLLLLFPLTAFGFQGNPTMEAISKALSSGDVETLSKYFADQVEISIADNEQLYSKSKAAETLKSFFGANKPKNFEQVHQGTSRENSGQYCIGNLSVSTGSFRVYLYMKSAGSALTIQEIRIDEE